MRPWLFALVVIVTLVVIGVMLWYSVGGKKDEQVALPPPPPPNVATHDELSTGIGEARALDEGLAPTSVKWARVIVLDDKRAVLTGEVVTETIALFTDDAGKTWRSFRSERDSWASWAVGLDGSVALAMGSRDGAPTPQSARVEAARTRFGALDRPELSVATPLFPTPKGPVTGLLQTVSAIPAVLGPDSAALIAEEAPKKVNLLYGGKPGADAVPPVKLPGGEKIVPVPYGRPPLMLSIKGKDLLQRPFPAAGKPLDKPQKVAGIATTPTLLAELSTPPACEVGAWSFQRTLAGKKGVEIVGFSPKKVLAFTAPDATVPTTAVSCSANKIVLEAVQAKTGAPATWAQQPDVPTLLTCDFDGKCATPQNSPFRVWAGPQKRDIVTAATEDGILGVMTARAGDKWGVYLAQAQNGTMYERQRVIGEGSGDRGRIELGALVSFGKRALLLISADVGGTSRRGWFVMATDDGGTSWNPP